VQIIYAELIALNAKVLTIEESALELADQYQSWNFRHIVRFDKIRLFNAVNIEFGYKPLQIFSPREVTTYGQEED
jgi:hypothetical protein